LEAGNATERPKISVKKSNKKIAEPQNFERPNPSNEVQAKSMPSEADLRGLASEKKAVLASLKTGEISLAGSDFERLAKRGTRSLKSYQVSPIYPKNEATLETSPNFRWHGTDNAEYRIIVSYLDGSQVDSSKVLSQNYGHLEKELTPGFYYWRIAVRRKGEKEEIVPGYIIFKVLSETEKQQIEAAVNSTKSNLVRAIIYARAGILEKAETELRAELNKNPDSSIAKKMLAQVQGWRRK
jgi:hypothetical protein